MELIACLVEWQRLLQAQRLIKRSWGARRRGALHQAGRDTLLAFLLGDDSWEGWGEKTSSQVLKKCRVRVRRGVCSRRRARHDELSDKYKNNFR